MEKTYFIQKRVIEQAERMKEKYAYILDVECFDLLIAGETEAYDKKVKEVSALQDELVEAFENIHSEGYSYKAPWKYVEILKKHAYSRDILDMRY